MKDKIFCKVFCRDCHKVLRISEVNYKEGEGNDYITKISEDEFLREIPILTGHGRDKCPNCGSHKSRCYGFKDRRKNKIGGRDIGLEENVIFEEIQPEEPDIHIRIDLYNKKARHFLLIMEYVRAKLNVDKSGLSYEEGWKDAEMFFRQLHDRLFSYGTTKVKEFTK